MVDRPQAEIILLRGFLCTAIIRALSCSGSTEALPGCFRAITLRSLRRTFNFSEIKEDTHS